MGNYFNYFWVLGVLINLEKEHAKLGRNVRLNVNHLEDWERRNGPFENGSVLLVQFGRSRYWLNRSKYLDLDSDNVTMNFPGQYQFFCCALIN